MYIREVVEAKNTTAVFAFGSLFANWDELTCALKELKSLKKWAKMSKNEQKWAKMTYFYQKTLIFNSLWKSSF